MNDLYLPSVPAIGRSYPHLPFHQTRNPVRHTGRGFRAKFSSRKMGRMIRCESLLEMHAVRLAEFARDIQSIEEQPFVLRYRASGRARRYTPDFRFRWKDGRDWVVEVKPQEKMALPRNQSKFARIADVISESGSTFVVLTEAQLRRDPLNDQIDQWLRRRRFLFPSTASAHLSELWADCVGKAHCSLTEAEQALGGKDVVQQLLADRDLVCDLNSIGSSGMTVRLFKEGDDHALFV
jgi:hypothetical protein